MRFNLLESTWFLCVWWHAAISFRNWTFSAWIFAVSCFAAPSSMPLNQTVDATISFMSSLIQLLNSIDRISKISCLKFYMNFNLMKPSDWYLLPNLHVSLSFCSVSFSGPGTRTGTLSTSPVSTNFASTRFWMAPLRTPICPSFSSHPFLEKESRIEIYRYSFLFPLPWIERKLVYTYFVIYFKILQYFNPYSSLSSLAVLRLHRGPYTVKRPVFSSFLCLWMSLLSKLAPQMTHQTLKSLGAPRSRPIFCSLSRISRSCFADRVRNSCNDFTGSARPDALIIKLS